MKPYATVRQAIAAYLAGKIDLSALVEMFPHSADQRTIFRALRGAF